MTLEAVQRTSTVPVWSDESSESLKPHQDHNGHPQLHMSIVPSRNWEFAGSNRECNGRKDHSRHLKGDVNPEPLREVVFSESGNEDSKRQEDPKCKPHEPSVSFEPADGTWIAFVGHIVSWLRICNTQQQHKNNNHQSSTTLSIADRHLAQYGIVDDFS